MALEDQAVNVDEGLVQAQADLLIQTGQIWHDQP
jgi:adhesin HecA-like repeat protein